MAFFWKNRKLDIRYIIFMQQRKELRYEALRSINSADTMGVRADSTPQERGITPGSSDGLVADLRDPSC